MSVLDDALALAKRGWPVFPIKPRDKVPNTTHGHKEATTDPDLNRIWFQSQPDANLGIRTGTDANLFVLDRDDRHGGKETLAALEAKHGPLPITVRSATGGGGEHSYFKNPGGTVRNRTAFLPGLDVRGEGGYVVAPPSVHPSGGEYRWQPGCSPDEVEVAEAPAWLLDLTVRRDRPRTKKSGSGADKRLRRRAEAYVAAVPGVGEGLRNEAAFKLAGQLRALCKADGETLTDEVLLDLMREWNAKNIPPLDDEELERCFRNSLTNGTPPPPKPPEHHEGIGDEPSPDSSQTPRALDGRRKLVLWGGDLHGSADQCLKTLAQEKPPVVFQWCRRLVLIVRPVDGQPPGEKRRNARIYDLTEAGLCDALNRRILFEIPKKNKETGEIEYFPIDCPVQLARWILARGQWPGIAILTGVLEVPTMLSDGRTLTAPGYDADSGLFLDFTSGDFPEIPASATREMALRALREEINPVVAEFPFERPEHRSVALSALLTTVSRTAFPTVPLHGFTAPAMASGKTLLADAVAIVNQGRTAPAIAQADTSEETEKRLHSVLLEGPRIVLIDNVQQALGGDVLCSAITGSSVGVRRFRTQEIVRVSTWGILWLVTGNNLAFEKDLRSRVLVSRLDPRSERPEQRTFAIPDLREYVKEHRARIVVALLTILRAYVDAGRPSARVRPLNRFEGWSALPRSALIWLGEADPVLTMNDIGQTDEETQTLESLLHALRALHQEAEFTAAEVIAEVAASPDLRDALNMVCLSRSGDAHDPRRLGRFLQRTQGRVVAGLRLELGSRAKGTNHYRVVEVPQPPDGGSGGRGGIDLSDVHAGDARACAPDDDEESISRVRPIGPLPPLPPLQPETLPEDPEKAASPGPPMNGRAEAPTAAGPGERPGIDDQVVLTFGGRSLDGNPIPPPRPIPAVAARELFRDENSVSWGPDNA